jgi:uncharacterized membrane protein
MQQGGGLQGLFLALWADERPGAKEEAIQVAKHALQICPNDNTRPPHQVQLLTYTNLQRR